MKLTPKTTTRQNKTLQKKGKNINNDPQTVHDLLSPLTNSPEAPENDKNDGFIAKTTTYPKKTKKRPPQETNDNNQNNEEKYTPKQVFKAIKLNDNKEETRNLLELF